MYCEYVRLDPVKPHTYSGECDATCNVCGETRVIENPHHVYDNGCDTTCNVCGAVREITHTYKHACSEYCSVCGQHRDLPEGVTHTWAHDCSTQCSECKTTRKDPPKTHTDENHDGICDKCGERIPSGNSGNMTEEHPFP